MTSSKKLSSAELRALFLQYFQSQGHQIVASSSLVPGNDPTLLFTNAGMVQFKDVFLGKDKRNYNRAASSQRCVRAGGKHNDLENVGYTARHHTFFEMLGNFSFGDYFKRDAIRFGWEFVTGKEWLGIDPKRLMVTVYHTDDEAFDIWHKEMGLPKERIVRIGDKPNGNSDNFWQMGDTGPCGPCTEIFYDHGAHIPGGPPGSPDEDGDRWIEIWNLVFMQFDRDASGKLNPLPKPSVDTGMGLERVAAVMQGVHSNYEIDLFQGLIRAAAQATGTKDLTSSSLRVIADHIRACSFLIADGVLPSNEGRGYVLRRIIRRAIRHGYKLGCNTPFFYTLVAALEKEMGAAYPELIEQRAHTERILKQEEENFSVTLANGVSLFEYETSSPTRAVRTFARKVNGRIVSRGGTKDRVSALILAGDEAYSVGVIEADATTALKPFIDLITSQTKSRADHLGSTVKHLFKKIFVLPSNRSIVASLRSQVSAIATNDAPEFIESSDLENVIPGDVVFRLYDTYGFPVDLTADIARERGLTIDEPGYDVAMEAQRDRARAASKFGVDLRANIAIEGKTAFTGYEHEKESATVVALIRSKGQVQVLRAGEEGQIVLDRTSFYAESGGQVGDTGELAGTGMRFEVSDTQKLGQSYAHIGRLIQGEVKVGDRVAARINNERRKAIRLNHSATHLLHAALRKVLGAHVTQKGSLVAPDRLRFDFSHYSAVTPDELKQVERLVNEQVRANAAAETKLMQHADAVASGAMALFGEKYDDEVRVLKIGDFSTELCGGTHVNRAGDIGLFKIVSEAGIAAGVRRIEAVTGEGALDWIASQSEALRNVAALVKGSASDVTSKVQQLIDRSRKQEKEIAQLKSKLASGQGSDLSQQAIDINGVKVVAARLDGTDAAALRDAVEQLKNKLSSAAIVLASVDADQKVALIAGVTPDQTARIKAGDLVNFVAQQVGGRGGGRPDMAQAGGQNPAQLDAALASVADWVRTKLTAT